MTFANAANSAHDESDTSITEAHGDDRMHIRLGCELTYYFPQPTHVIAMLNVHYSRFGDLARPDHLITNPAVPIQSYRDSFGNWCCRFTAPAGEFVMGTDTILRDSGLPETTDMSGPQHDVEELPDSALLFLLPSRYCDSDLLMSEAWRLFGHIPPGWDRVRAILDFVHNHLVFNYQNARNTRTAAEAYNERTGVCRDFTHLAIAFLRAMNIPAKYCNGYISDMNQPPPYASMDFAAWIKIYMGGRWHDVDPRNNRPMTGRVLISQGRDAADVPLTHTFGWGALNGFKVWIEDVNVDASLAQAPAVSVAGPPASL